jgi:hypothetical protein
MAATVFALTQDETNSFLSQVPQAAQDIDSMHVGFTGTPSENWETGTNKAIPPYGKAYAWGSRWILVSIDAKYIWHFIDVTSSKSLQGLIANANNPEYISPTGNVFEDIWASYSGGASNALANIAALPGNALKTLEDAAQSFYKGVQDDLQSGLQSFEHVFLLLLVVVAVIVIVAAWRLKAFDIPGLSIKGGA